MFDFFPISRSDFDGRVLVTGAGGCIGSWALTLLTRAGVPVSAFDLSEDTRRPSLLMSDAELSRIQWLSGDIADLEAVFERRANQRCARHHPSRRIAGAVLQGGSRGRRQGQRGRDRKRIRSGAQAWNQAYRIRELDRGTWSDREPFASGSGQSHDTLPTLYGAYKHCNEQTAKVYSQDWGVHSVGLRPGVVYGVGRDQGLTSKTTVAILAAAANNPYTIPFRGPISWLHAGEVASAFIRAVAKERSGAPVFDINGVSTTVERSLEVLKKVAPTMQVSWSGDALPFPMDLSDEPVHAYLGDYGSVPLETGIRSTYEAFQALLAKGLIKADSVA